jgi:hypothetical protein
VPPNCGCSRPIWHILLVVKKMWHILRFTISPDVAHGAVHHRWLCSLPGHNCARCPPVAAHSHQHLCHQVNFIFFNIFHSTFILNWRWNELREKFDLGRRLAPGRRDARGYEKGTEIFWIDCFRFLYYKPFFNMKNYQFQSVSQPFSTIFCTL